LNFNYAFVISLLLVSPLSLVVREVFLVGAFLGRELIRAEHVVREVASSCLFLFVMAMALVLQVGAFAGEVDRSLSSFQVVLLLGHLCPGYLGCLFVISLLLVSPLSLVVREVFLVGASVGQSMW
jgi:hypothetical protein